MTRLEGGTTTVRRRWVRFSVRTLTVVVALISLALAWETNRARKQASAVAAVRNLNGSVFYNSHQAFGLEGLLPEDILSGVVAIDFAFTDISDTDLERLTSTLQQFPSLVWLRLSGSQITPDATIAIQRALPNARIYNTLGPAPGVPPRFTQADRSRIVMSWGEKPFRLTRDPQQLGVE